MEEYADIYYLDEARNAVRRVRTPATRPGVYLPAPGAVTRPAAPVAPAPAPAVVYNQPMPAYNQQAMGFWGNQPVYAPAPYPQVLPQPAAIVGSMLGRLTLGDVIQLAAQGFAALKSLPDAPDSTGSSETDVSNLTLYQKALAEHAKRDEQLRTLGNLVAKLVG
jgi:hypothetical protein